MRLLLIVVSLTILNIVNGQNNFVENNGQISDQNGSVRTDIFYSLQTDNGSLFIHNKGFCIQLLSENFDGVSVINRVDYIIEGVEFDIIQGLDEKEYKETHIGEQGTFQCASFGSVLCTDEDNGIQLKFYSLESGFKYDIILKEACTFNEVNINIAGADLSLGENRDELLLTVKENMVIKDQMPKSWIDHAGSPRINVKSEYQITDNGITIQFEEKGNQKLIIDPLVTYGTYYGGPGGEDFRAVGTDSLSNIYAVGTTSSTSNIATVGAYETNYTPGSTYLVKLNNEGVRQWGTYFHFYTAPRQLEVDKDGSIYFSGMTGSGNYLGTPGAHQTFFGGGYNDMYLIKLTNEGFPIWSTMYGGSGNEVLYEMELYEGYVYLAGYTNSPDLIATPGAFIDTKQGNGNNEDGAIAKFDTTGQLIVATYLGSSNADKIEGMDISEDGYIYVSGDFDSNGLGTAGSFYPTKLQNSDFFVSKFTPDLDQVWGSYYVGSSFLEIYHKVAVKGNNLIVGATIIGSAGDGSYTTPGAHKELSEANYEMILVHMDTSGTNVNWATYYGGNLGEYIADLTFSEDTTIVISGMTRSSDQIATTNVHKDYFSYGTWFGQVNSDAFVTVFNNSGQQLWGSYYGGAHIENCYDMELTKEHEIVVVGNTQSTSGIAFGAYHQGFMANSINYSDAYVVKFDLERDSIFTDVDGTLQSSICPNETVTIPFEIEGYFFDDNEFELESSDEFGDFTNGQILDVKFSNHADTFVVTLPGLIESGNYRFRVNSSHPSVKGVPTAYTSILNSPNTQFSFQQNANAFSFIDGSNGAITWSWDFGNGSTDNVASPIYIYPTTGTYEVMLVSSNGTCQDTASHTVLIEEMLGESDVKLEEISVYPNPTDLGWTLDLGQNLVEINLFDITGKVILQKMHCSGKEWIDAKTLESGIYYIEIIDVKSHQIVNFKVIKE